MDISKELEKILNEELEKIWESYPLGYDEVNKGYHMGKGLFVNKHAWDKYNNALILNSELDAYVFMINLLKEESKNEI